MIFSTEQAMNLTYLSLVLPLDMSQSPLFIHSTKESMNSTDAIEMIIKILVSMVKNSDFTVDFYYFFLIVLMFFISFSLIISKYFLFFFFIFLSLSGARSSHLNDFQAIRRN